MAILRFLAYTNIWIAATALAFLYLTSVEAQAPLDAYLLLFVGGGTFGAYYLMRMPAALAPAAQDDAAVVRWQRILGRKLKWPAVLAIILAGVMSSVAFPKPAFFTALAAGVLALSYSLVLPKKSAQPKGLRNIPGLKLSVVTLTWVLVTYVLPLLYWEQEINVFGILARGCMVAALALIFDIRDVQNDLPSIRTIPQRWGAQNARYLAYGFVGIAWASLIWMTMAGQVFSWPQFIVMWVVLEIKSLMIYQTQYPQPDLFYVFGVEGLPILMALLVAFFT